MSFFGKFKTGATASITSSNGKKDAHAPRATALEKHLADYTDPIRADGSDKFFGLENYGSTCYANSVIQCLYYSEPFRESVLNFPSPAFLEHWKSRKDAGEEQYSHVNGTLGADGAPTSPSRANTSSTTSSPYPNPTSPARKPLAALPIASPQKADEARESPDYKKKLAIQAGPVLDMTDDRSKEYAMNESLFTSLKDIFAAITTQQSRIGVVSPHKFLEILRKENEMFRSAMHQDAHEFLNLLLNSVVENVEQFTKQHLANSSNGTHDTNGSHDDSRTAQKKGNGGDAQLALDPRWVHDIFEGVLTSETRCLTCETISQRDEAFLDLSVDLSPHTSVTSCLRKFSQEEMLCERDKFQCDNCGGLQEAEKRMKIKSLPRVLALHLKRFKYTEDLQRLQKLFHKVVYPFHLRLFNTTDDAEDADRLYELYAVVVHIGGGPYHGHYVSIIKTQDRGWLLFDDELVEPVDKNYVLGFFGGEPAVGASDSRHLACAYVLFYQETTLEAVLREQEAERDLHQAAAATQDSEHGNKAIANPISPATDAFKLLGLTSPVHDHAEQYTVVSAATPPPPPPPQPLQPASKPLPPLPPRPSAMPTNPPLGDASKSKKELKAEEKERRAAQKAEEKLVVQRQREASDKHTDVLRRQDEDLKRIYGVSREANPHEHKKRGEDGTHHEKSGFSRFMRPGSMSLKGKPKAFASSGHDESRDRDAARGEEAVGPHDGSESAAWSSQTPKPHAMEELVKEHKEKKNRFSLGRKRSTQLF